MTRATGAVMREMKGEPAEGNHLVLRVELPEGLYLADVGFGDGPLDPIRIAPGAFHSGGFTFQIEQADPDWWRLRHHALGAAPCFDFHLERANEDLLRDRCAARGQSRSECQHRQSWSPGETGQTSPIRDRQSKRSSVKSSNPCCWS